MGGGESRGCGRGLYKSGECGVGPGDWRVGPDVFLIPLLPTPAALRDFVETSPARQYATVVAKFPHRDPAAVSWGFTIPPCTVRGLRNMEIQG